MKAVILAAGYSKRLPHHVRTTPKALLNIAGRPLVETILHKILGLEDVDEVFIVTNDLHLRAFQRWEESQNLAKPVRIISDGTSAHHERLGALGDLRFVIETRGVSTDLLVVAGDNFFEFDLFKLVDEFRRAGGSVVALCDLGNPQRLVGRFGAATLNPETHQIIRFSEKPSESETSLASTLCYLLTSEDVRNLIVYKEEHPSSDETGSFVEYLISEGIPVFGFVFNERWVDIGNYDDYRALNQTEIKKRLETDPTFRQPIDAVIMFADIIGSATISEYSSDEAYDDFIAEFQTSAREVVERNMGAHGIDAEDQSFCEWSVRGDELVLLLYTKRPERDVKMAVDIAIQLKRAVFLSSFNRSRQGRSFFDVGIGIHYGRVVIKRHPSISGTGRRFNAEGYSINLCKRIEGHSRKGTFSKIILSKRFSELITTPKILSERQDVDLKGIYGPFPVYELQVWGNVDVPEEAKRIAREDIDYYVAALENSAYDMWLSLLVARHFYDEEDYPTAEKYYEGAIKSFPEFAEGHRYLGRCFYRQNEFRKARQALESACKFEPLSPKSHNYLAITLRRLKEYSLAFEHHEDATKFEPNSPYEYNAFAYTIAEAWWDHKDRVERERYDLARAGRYLERAELLFGTKRSDYDYVLEHTRGMIHLADHYYDEAIKCFENALASISRQREMMPKKREEKRGEIFYHLGAAFHERGGGFSKESLEFLRKSLESPEIAAKERLPYYWFSDARETIREMTAPQAVPSSSRTQEP